MNIAELKEAIEDMDDDLEVRVNLFNKATVGVESVDFTTYADNDEEIACIVMEGEEIEKQAMSPADVAAGANSDFDTENTETAKGFQERMKGAPDNPGGADEEIAKGDPTDKPA